MADMVNVFFLENGDDNVHCIMKLIEIHMFWKCEVAVFRTQWIDPTCSCICSTSRKIYTSFCLVCLVCFPFDCTDAGEIILIDIGKISCSILHNRNKYYKPHTVCICKILIKYCHIQHHQYICILHHPYISSTHISSIKLMH